MRIRDLRHFVVERLVVLLSLVWILWLERGSGVKSETRPFEQY